MTLLLAFVVFAVAVAGLAVGVMLTGRSLSSSCGGLATKEGEILGDCHCARKDAHLCASEDEEGLVRIAEIGYPQRKDHWQEERERFQPVEQAFDEERFEV